MFNFYKYSFLIIINLSLADKIDSCNNLIIPGIYVLDKVRIDKDYYYNVSIDLREMANLAYINNDQYGDFIAYTLEGTIKYFQNSENNEINILYCTDFNSKDESIKESSVTLTNGFKHDKQPLSFNILNSNIVHFQSKVVALERDYQLLNNDLFPQGIWEPKGIYKYEDPIRTYEADKIASSMVSQEPQTKNGELTIDKITEAQSSVSEIASQSSGAEAGISNQSIGGFNGEVENNGVQESKTILVNKISDLKPILDNLDKNKSLELIPKSKISKIVKFTKIIVNYDHEAYNTKYYKITVFYKKKREVTYRDILILLYINRNNLRIKFYPRKRIKVIGNDSEGEKFTPIELVIENCHLSLLTNIPPDEKKREHQLVSDLEKQYGKNFIYLFEVTPSSDKKILTEIIYDLNGVEKLVFYQSEAYSAAKNYKAIEITKSLETNEVFGVNHYSILIKYLSGEEETIESTPISVSFYKNSVRLRFLLPSNGNMIEKKFTVTNFHLIKVNNLLSLF